MKRKALFTSILALLLCVSMLVGTTYAWFTDTASTGVNTIQSGNLDLEVYYAFPSDVVDGDIPAENWKRVDANTPVFNQDALWEPGYTEVVFFKFDNAGSLAFQYQMNVDILAETPGKTAAGADIQLSNHINAYINNTFSYNYQQFLATVREDATNPAGAPNPYYGILSEVANMAPCRADNYTENALSLDSWQWLEPTETTYATLVLWMPTDIGNEANHDGVNIPEIDLAISVVATQYNWTAEKDSFDHNYDKNAAMPITAPILNAEPAPYVGECYEEGTNVVAYKDLILYGHAYISIDSNASVAVENVTADVDGSVIIMKDYQPAIYINGGDFTIDAGEYLIDASAIAGGVYQIFLVDVKVNGEYLTQETAGQYLNNVNWFGAYRSN